MNFTFRPPCGFAKALRNLALATAFATIVNGTGEALDQATPDAMQTVTPLGASGKPHICAMKYYPSDALKVCAQGTAIVQFIVTAEGKVANPKIMVSSGNAALDAASTECVRDWVYTPATQSGKPIAVLWRARQVWALADVCVPSQSSDSAAMSSAGTQTDNAQSTPPK
jgi:TonB family protein